MSNSNTFQSRYPEGYTLKIEYYQAKLSNAVDVLDIKNIKFHTKKLEYFLDRQASLEAKIECSATLDNVWANESI
jgi:hypothetical protein